MVRPTVGLNWVVMLVGGGGRCETVPCGSETAWGMGCSLRLTLNGLRTWYARWELPQSEYYNIYVYIYIIIWRQERAGSICVCGTRTLWHAVSASSLGLCCSWGSFDDTCVWHTDRLRRDPRSHSCCFFLSFNFTNIHMYIYIIYIYIYTWYILYTRTVLPG